MRPSLGADERRELLLRYGNDIILLFDEAFRLVDCNDRALEAYGYSREELLTKSIGDLRVPQAHIDMDRRMAEVREAGSAVFESVNRRKDGSTFPVETSVRTVQTPSGLFYPTTVRDITDRRLAELDLIRREEEQRAVLTSLAENIITLDPQGRVTYINHTEPGIDEAEVLGSKWLEWLDEAARPQAEAAVRTTVETGELQEIEFLALGPQRQPSWYRVRIAPLPASSPDAVVIMATDVTAGRRTERDLRDAVQRMRQAERTARVGHWRHDVRTGKLEPSEELLRIVGAPPGAADADAEEFVHPDDRAQRRRYFEQVLAGEPYTGHEWRAIRPDGAVRYLSGSAEPVFDDAGNVVAVFGVTQDVTERTEALLAARESSEQYRALLENMLEGFAYCRMVYDDEGRPDDFIYLSVNPAFYRLTGLEDAVGKRVTELIPGIKESNPELFELYGRVAATGEPAEFDIDFVPIQRWLHVSATRPREDEFVAFFSDVTERKEASASPETARRGCDSRSRPRAPARGSGTSAQMRTSGPTSSGSCTTSTETCTRRATLRGSSRSIPTTAR